MRLILATVLSLLSVPHEASACSISPDWHPPTVETALTQAEVVLQAKVISVEREGGVSLAKVSVDHVLKGRYSGDVVETGAGGLCGIGTFKVGQTYVLFFERRGSWWVSGMLQPRSNSEAQWRLLDANEVIPAVAAILKRNREAPGVWVPETQWDLPPYRTMQSALRLLDEREQQYQLSLFAEREQQRQLRLRHRSWLVWAGVTLALMVGLAGTIALRSRWLRAKRRRLEQPLDL